MRILIADDDRAFREMMELTLKGHDVILAENGAEAIASAECYQPDVILLDVMMPEVDGFTALAQLQAGRHTADIPVILVSAAYTRPGDIRRGLDLGAVEYLAKPVSPFALRAKLEGWARAAYAGRQKKGLGADPGDL